VTLSFNDGKFPEKYRKALVTPLLKKDGLDANVYVNYRPISNLHTISKIVERAHVPPKNCPYIILKKTREMCSRIDMHTHVAAHPGPSPSRTFQP